MTAAIANIPSHESSLLTDDQGHPLGHYLLLMGTFAALSVGTVTALRRLGRPYPNPSVKDMVLLALGTTRLSRLLSRDKVTRVLRAPFTEVKEDIGAGEVKEQPKGEGSQRAIGELLVCPRCTAFWVSAGLTYLYMYSPSVARLACTMLSASAVSDYVNLQFAAARQGKT